MCPLPAMQFPLFLGNHQSSPKPLRSSASLLVVLETPRTLQRYKLFSFSVLHVKTCQVGTHLASGIQHADGGDDAVPRRRHCRFGPSQRRLTDPERCRHYHASWFVNHHQNRVDHEHGLALPLPRYKLMTFSTRQLATLPERLFGQPLTNVQPDLELAHRPVVGEPRIADVLTEQRLLFRCGLERTSQLTAPASAG